MTEKEDRQRAILGLLGTMYRESRAPVPYNRADHAASWLAEYAAASVRTVRRDLCEMEARGLVIRIHGRWRIAYA